MLCPECFLGVLEDDGIELRCDDCGAIIDIDDMDDMDYEDDEEDL